MAFSLSNTTFNQSGIDTSLAGITTMVAAIPVVVVATAYSVNTYVKPPSANGFIYRCTVAGTTAATAPAYGMTAGGTTVDGTASFLAVIAPYSQIVGARTVYRISTFQAAFSGTLTWDAKLEGLEFYDCPTSPVVSFNSPAVITINSVINGKATYDDALIIRPSAGTIQTELRINSGVTFNLNGGRIYLSGIGSSDYQSVYINKGATINVTNGWIKSSKNQVRWGESGTGSMLAMNINGLIAEKIFTTIFGVFGGLNGLAPLNSVTQTVAYGAFTSFTLRDYSPLDTGSFLDNYDIPNLYVVNSLGSGLDYRSGKGPAKWISLQKEFTLKTLTAAGAAINGAVAYVRDTNNGGRINIPAIPNQLSDNVYLQSTAGAGITPTMALWVMHAEALFGYQSTPTRDYRTKTTVAGADLFDVSVLAYGYVYALLSNVPMKGAGVLALSSNLIADANVTLTEAAAVTKLASSFTVAGNVLTVTTNSTLDDIYDAMKAYKTRPVQAQVEYPSISAQPVTAAGSQLTTAMSIVVNAGATLTAGAKFKTITCAGVTALGTITTIAIGGNVTQASPTDLTGVSITGTLTYNAVSTAQFTFTNSTLGTVTNSGAGIVTIRRVNSNLTTGTNVVAYIPTTVSFTLSSGRIRVLNHLGVEQFNQTADGTFELPVSATGTWSYKIAKYGNKAIEGTFTVDGTTKTIVPAYIPDTFVVDTLANVQAYTTLETTQKIYDYYSLYLASASGILLTKSVVLTSAKLDIGSYALSVIAVGVVGNVIGINASVISGVNLVTTSAQVGISPTYPQLITDAATTTTWLNLTLNNGRIRILDSLSAEYMNTVSDGTTLLPYSATGTWSYKIVKYGSQPIFGTFSVDGIIKFISASYIPDTLVVDTLANVTAYTALETVQKIYDYYSLYLASSTGILITKSVTLNSTLLNLGAYAVSNGALSVSSTSIGTNSSTVSGVNVTSTGNITGLIPIYPQQLADPTGTTNWLKTVLTAGQVYQDSFNFGFSTVSSTTLLPTSFGSALTIYVTRRGYKKQTITVPYTQTLLPVQSFNLIPDTNVLDVVTDLASADLTSSQLIYDAFSQYQSTVAGISDVYVPIKTPGAIDFTSKGFRLFAATDFSLSPLRLKSSNLSSDTYYSQQAITQGSATLANSVLIRASNLNSELVFTPDALTFYPTATDRDSGNNAGATVTGGVYRFLYGSVVSGVNLSGTIYLRVTVGGLIFFADLPITSGANVMDLGVQGQLTAISAKLDTKPSKAEIGSLVWETPLDTTLTAKKVLNTTAAALAGKATGGGTSVIALRNLSDTANAIVMAVDVNGNRSNVVIAP